MDTGIPTGLKQSGSQACSIPRPIRQWGNAIRQSISQLAKPRFSRLVGKSEGRSEVGRPQLARSSRRHLAWRMVVNSCLQVENNVALHSMHNTCTYLQYSSVNVCVRVSLASKNWLRANMILQNLHPYIYSLIRALRYGGFAASLPQVLPEPPHTAILEEIRGPPFIVCCGGGRRLSLSYMSSCSWRSRACIHTYLHPELGKNTLLVSIGLQLMLCH